MATTVISGNTARLEVRFYTFAKALGDPTSVVLRVYDGNWKQIGADLTPTNGSVGYYYYDYTMPAEVEGTLFYVFSGIMEGSVILGPGQLEGKRI